MIGLIQKIVKYTGKYATRIRISYIFAFLKSFCAKAPYLVALFLINELMEKRADISTCIISAAILFLFLVLQSVFTALLNKYQAMAGYDLFADKRIELGKHLRKLPMGYFMEGNIGEISTVLSNDMVFIEELSMQAIGESVSDIFSQLILTVFLFILHPLIGLAALITEVIAVLVAIPMKRESMESSRGRQESIKKMTSAVLEYAQGIDVIKSFNMTGESAKEIRKSFADVAKESLSFEKNHVPFERGLLMIYCIGAGAILLVSVYLFGENALRPVEFVGVLLFSFGIFASIEHYYQQMTQFTIMEIGLNKLKKIMDEKEIEDTGKSDIPAEFENELAFNNVSFSYGNEQVLKGISFSVKKGETLALVGASGSGKTTIASLLARFWDIKEGEISFRGKDIRSLPLDGLMEQISMVFQKVYLFEDTVYNNIAMGLSSVDKESVYEAAKKARCYDFIMKLPYGFDTFVGSGGATLSGGEAQRISIARCILKNSPVIILDEATASIDADNESHIQAALSELCEGKTTIVIAHRLNTIKKADKILVLDKGRIIQEGNHEELAGVNGAYRNMILAGGGESE